MENTMNPAPSSTNDTPHVPLVSIPVTDDNVALNLMVGFIGVAQKRGAFSLDEAAKLWECISRFTQREVSP